MRPASEAWLSRTAIFVGAAGGDRYRTGAIFPALKATLFSQMPILHGSRDNYILNMASGMNFGTIPMGASLIALPFIFWRGGGSPRSNTKIV